MSRYWISNFVFSKYRTIPVSKRSVTKHEVLRFNNDNNCENSYANRSTSIAYMLFFIIYINKSSKQLSEKYNNCIDFFLGLCSKI